MPSKPSKPAKRSKKGARGLRALGGKAHAAGKHSKKGSRNGRAATERTAAKKVRTVAAKRPGVKKQAVKAVAKRRAAPKKIAAPKRPAARKVRKTAGRSASAEASRVGAPIRRREGGGHMPAAYAKDLLGRGGARAERDAAFIDRPHSKDDLAEELGEQAVETMTSGEDEGEDLADQDVPEERGGPFVVTTAGTEFAEGVDASNPRGAKREPFPTT